VSIPKSKGLCQLILVHGYDGQRVSRTEGEDYDTAVIIDDLSQHEKYASEWFINDGPHIRFYAGVPLLCPDGSAIGALCIFDDVPRKGLSRDDLVIMQDLAATVMQHLTTYKFERDLRRGERMVRGLTSFIEGAKSLQPAYSPGDSPPSSPTSHSSSHSLSEQTKSIEQSSHNAESGTDAQDTMKAILAPPREVAGATATANESKSEPKSESHTEKSNPLVPEQQVEPPGVDGSMVPKLNHQGQSPSPGPRNTSPHPRDSLLPMGAKLMFARAANIIRETSDLDGVIMFDASVAANKTRTSSSRKAPPALERESSGQTDDSGESSEVGSPYPHGGRFSQLATSQSSHEGLSNAHRRGRRMCHMLCFSDGDKSSVSGETASPTSSYRNLPESDLKRILDRYPEGKVINFDAYGNISSTDDEYVRSRNATSAIKIPKSAAKKSRRRSIAEALQAIIPGARSVAILPSWDYDRSRWFSVGIFFTMNERRILTPELDLIYFKAFSNTIMTELSRLDAINSNNTKTTFVASISHELRSPLHGILGGVEFMQGSSMNAFQASMLNSIEMCGKTLLDTVDHVLDWSKINELTKTKSRPTTKMRMKSSKRVLVSPLRSRRHEELPGSRGTTIDLAVSAEEVVEAVFAGKSYRVMSNRVDEQPKMAWPGTRKTQQGRNSPRPHGDTDRKNILILLDIPHRENWRFQTQPGAWRRILMNLFGNALKYTESGFIRVSLAARNAENPYRYSSPDPDDSTGSLSSIETKFGHPGYIDHLGFGNWHV
jgi:signal transduction histidine kinase